jgi:uncharacterized protein YmfQ (DUF2313 family)
MKHCQWCDKEFKTDITYQIYCSSECRDMSTKEKIAARYIISRRQKRKGKERNCKSCKEALSIYNDETLCVKCNVNPSDVAKALKEIKDNLK